MIVLLSLRSFVRLLLLLLLLCATLAKAKFIDLAKKVIAHTMFSWFYNCFSNKLVHFSSINTLLLCMRSIEFVNTLMPFSITLTIVLCADE